MNLFTRCPKCGTAFRVHPAQLSAKGGQVRCGKCDNVFDGVAALVEQSIEAQSAQPSPQLGLFEPGQRPPDPRHGARAVSSSPALPEVEPRFLEEPEASRPFNVAWALCALIALAALLAQAALHFRTELAVLWPEARPKLVELCAALNCRVRLPRHPELMSIESSDLQADRRRDGLIVLNAVIRNRAAFAQEYPELELTLTDAADQAVVRRVLHPQEYLGSPRAEDPVGRGVAGGAEALVRIYFDTGVLRASGYRLYLFYP